VTALPFAAGEFDVVLCNHVIEHVPAPQAAAAELVRVLRPGGMVIVGVPNEGCALAQLRNRMLQPSILRGTDHVNFFTAASLGRLLTGAGLKMRSVHASGFFLPHLRLAGLVTSTSIGRDLLDIAGQLLPSQGADLIAIAVRPS
jgi:2-polyprenyl-3-methyl-5-hydroxy-6-metoxy-1,4-benzoquinol methylase